MMTTSVIRLIPALLAGVALGFAAPPSMEPAHAPIALKKPLEDKLFPLLAAIDHDKAVGSLFRDDSGLQQILKERGGVAEKAMETCKNSSPCMGELLLWHSSEIDGVWRAMERMQPKMSSVVRELRRAGIYQNLAAKSDVEFLQGAWQETAAAFNRIVNTYANGVAARYPAIDAPSYDVKSQAYGRTVEAILEVLCRDKAKKLFYTDARKFAVSLLEINNRNEAARFEPLDTGLNSDALDRVAHIHWKNYAYSVIVVPGAGSEVPNVSLSPFGKLRLALAVQTLHQKKAPFILVSGGFVHPSQTPFAEAIEMRRYLLDVLRVRPDAVLVDPQARHTTTNMRNAARLLYRYGIPFDKPALVTTDGGQSQYIEGKVFAERCRAELGYMPMTMGRRLSHFEQEFLPAVLSLTIDPNDPLDP